MKTYRVVRLIKVVFWGTGTVQWMTVGVLPVLPMLRNGVLDGAVDGRVVT